MIDPFHIALARVIDHEVVARSMKLGAGQADDYAQYRELVGIIVGLNIALSIADDIEKERYGTPREGTE